jgi:hypothetical protein
LRLDGENETSQEFSLFKPSWITKSARCAFKIVPKFKIFYLFARKKQYVDISNIPINVLKLVWKFRILINTQAKKL